MRKVLLGLFVVIIAVFLMIVFRPSSLYQLEALRTKYSTEQSNYFTYDKHSYHYTKKGSEEPIVFIHGFAGSAFTWDTLINKIDSNYRCLALDLPGFGLSEVNEAKLDGDLLAYYLDVFNAFLVENEIDSFNLVGTSMGGYISMEIANHYGSRVKTLCLSNPLCYSGRNKADKASKILGPNFFKSLEKKGIPKWMANLLFSRSANKPLAKSEITKRHELNSRSATIQVIESILQNKGIVKDDIASKLINPSLIIWGQDDKVLNPSLATRLNNDIRNSSLKLYNNVGHMSFYEASDRFKEDLMELINS